MSYEFTQYNQKKTNEDILRQSELGVILSEAYIKAVELDPRLSDISIIPIADRDNQRLAFALPSWSKSNQTGQQEIHIRLGNLDETLAIFENRLRHTSTQNAIIAETLGIGPEKLTPQLLFVYSMLHELGHTLEFMDYLEAGKTPEEHRHDRNIELGKLPLAKITVRHLLSLEHPKRRLVEEHWDTAREVASAAYSIFTGNNEDIGSITELIDATSYVYRNTRFEAAADKFAATVLKSQPDMLEQLTGDITRIRNYPGNAWYDMAS